MTFQMQDSLAPSFLSNTLHRSQPPSANERLFWTDTSTTQERSTSLGKKYGKNTCNLSDPYNRDARKKTSPDYNNRDFFQPNYFSGSQSSVFRFIPWLIKHTPPKSNIDTKNDNDGMENVSPFNSNIAILGIYVRFQGGTTFILVYIRDLSYPGCGSTRMRRLQMFFDLEMESSESFTK